MALVHMMWTFLVALNMQNCGESGAGFVPHSHRGMPRPYFRVPMQVKQSHVYPPSPMISLLQENGNVADKGDGWLADARTIHWGGITLKLFLGFPEMK